jgi:hypothetical protein
VVQASEELGEEEEQEVADEQEEVERREGAEEEERRRRHHCTSWFFHAAAGGRRSVDVTTKPVLVEAEAEAMRRSLRAKHLLQHRHTGTPAAAARIVAHLPRLAESVIDLLERERERERQRRSVREEALSGSGRDKRDGRTRSPTRTADGAHRHNRQTRRPAAPPPALFERKVAMRDEMSSVASKWFGEGDTQS